MAKLNVSGYGESLHRAFFDPIEGLYTSNASTPLGAGAGLRQFYRFGLYSHCAYIDDKQGLCGNHTIGDQFRPYDAITSDMSANYTAFTNAIISSTSTFRDSSYLGQSSKAAYWMLLLGTICAALALITGFAKNNFTFFLSSITAIAGSIMILVSASIWTVLVNKSAAVNNIIIQSPGTEILVGIELSAGSGLFITWAAFACLFVSVVPYMVSCCTYRG